MTTADAATMTYDEAFTRLTTEFGLPELTARNMLLTALKGQSAWFGGSLGCLRLVHDSGVTREDGYRLLSDGWIPVLLEFTEDGRILATAGLDAPVQVGTIAREEPRLDEADCLWHALLWATAGVPGEFGRLDGKIAGQRYGQNAEQCERRVRARLAEYGPWWTAKEA